MRALGESATRPLPSVLTIGMALLTGALAVQVLPVLLPRWFDAALLVVASVIFAAQARWCRSATLLLAATAIAAFAWTALRADAALQARLPHGLEGRDLVITGSIDDLPQAQDESTRFDLDIASARLDGSPVSLRGVLRLSWYASRNGAPPQLAPCSRWRLLVRLKRPRSL